jgi:hypothetical protein
MDTRYVYSCLVNIPCYFWFCLLLLYIPEITMDISLELPCVLSLNLGLQILEIMCMRHFMGNYGTQFMCHIWWRVDQYMVACNHKKIIYHKILTFLDHYQRSRYVLFRLSQGQLYIFLNICCGHDHIGDSKNLDMSLFNKQDCNHSCVLVSRIYEHAWIFFLVTDPCSAENHSVYKSWL